jgi:hypothetical protein
VVQYTQLVKGFVLEDDEVVIKSQIIGIIEEQTVKIGCKILEFKTNFSWLAL